MSQLSELQIELLKSIQNTPDCKTVEQLVAENGHQVLYDNCKFLQDNGYFTQNVSFHLSVDKELFVTSQNNTPLLTERGIDAIKSVCSMN